MENILLNLFTPVTTQQPPKVWIFVAIALVGLFFLKCLSAKKKGRKKRNEKESRRDYLVSLYREIVKTDQEIAMSLRSKKYKAYSCMDGSAANQIESALWKFRSLEETLNNEDFSNYYFEDAEETILDYLDRFRSLLSEIEQIEITDYKKQYEEEEEEECSREQEKIGICDNSKYYFGCTDISELTKKYHLLSKLHHPDAGGDAAEFINIKKEYEKYRDIFKKESGSE